MVKFFQIKNLEVTVLGILTEIKAGLDILDWFKRKFQRKGEIFEYLKFFKKLAVYETGHGIVINSLEIKVLDKLDEIERFFDIKSGRGCKDAHLPPLEEMKKKNEKKRFKEAGFWYKSDIPCELLVKEDFEDRKKFAFKWITPLEKGRKVNLCYAFSAPCMFPIENGIFRKEKACTEDPQAEANFEVRSMIRHFEYEIAFRGVELEESPIMKVFKGDHFLKNEKPEVYFDPFYTRYRFSLKKPNVGYKITIQWRWKTK